MIFDVPKVNNTLRSAITPVNSAVIYNTDNNRYEYYNGSEWKPFGEGQVISFNTRTGNVTLLDSDIASLGDFTVSGTLTINNDIIFGSEALKLMTSDFDPSISGVNASVGSVIFKTDGTIWQKLDANSTDWSKIQTSSFTGEPTGFPVDSVGDIDRTSSSISFNEGNRNFSISPTSGSFIVLLQGRQYRKTSTESIQISNDEGIHYIYYDLTGTLRETTVFSVSLIEKYAIISIIYWDSTNSKLILFGDERHGCTMDGHTHVRIHVESGAIYTSGMGLDNFTIDGNGSSENHLTYSVGSGSLRDEDILHTLSSKGTNSGIPVLYREGQVWRSVIPTINSGVYARALGSIGDPTQIAFNQLSGGSWSRVNVSGNNYVCYHLMATNDINHPYMIIMGTNQYSSKTDAQTGAITEISTLTGLPFVEVVFVGTILFECKTSNTNSLKAAIISVNGGNYVDWRFRTTLNPSTASVNSHNSLGGIYGGSPYYHSNQPINTTDNVIFNSLNLTEKVSLSSEIIYTNVGNLNSSIINSNYSVIKLNPNSATTLHGIGDVQNGKVIILQNISSTIDILIKHQSTSEAVSTRRIITDSNSDFYLKKNTSLILIYSSSDSRWKFISINTHNQLSLIDGGNGTNYYHSDQPINISDLVQFGGLNINGQYSFPTSDGSNGQTLVTNGSGTLSFGTIDLNHNNLLSLQGGGGGNYYHSDQPINVSDPVQFAGLNINGQYSLPTSDGSNGQTLVTNGSGTLSFGTIDLNHNNLLSLQGGGGGNYYHSDQPININNIVQFAGLNINGQYSLPTSDGSSGQTLVTNGSGTLSFGTIDLNHNNLLSLQGGGGGNYYHSDQPINVSDSPTFSGLTINGDLNVSGTTTYLEVVNLQVKDKNIELNKIDSPSDIIADGGGITLKGTTDKTLIWSDATDSWTSSENIDLASGTVYRINNTTVLSSTQVLGKNIPTGDIVGTSDTQNLSNKTLNGFTLTNNIISTSSIDFDLADNNSSAISFDTSGKTGILEIDTTDNFETVKMSSDLAVSGTTNLKNINASGTLTFNGLNFPVSDGTEGQILTTNGSGNLYFSDSGGGAGTVLDTYITSKAVQINNDSTSSVSALFNNQVVSGIYTFWISSDPRIKGIFYLNQNDITNSVLETISLSVSGKQNISNSLNVYISNGNVIFQNKLGSQVVLAVRRETSPSYNGGGSSITSVTSHADLMNLQGGDGQDYYHSNQPINTTNTVTFAGINVPLIENNASGTISNVSTDNVGAYRFTCESTTTITGFANGVNGKLLYLHNGSAVNIIIKNNSTSSLLENRIITGNNNDLIFKPDKSITLQYDSFSSKWRMLGGNTSASTGENPITLDLGNSNTVIDFSSYHTTSFRIKNPAQMTFTNGTNGVWYTLAIISDGSYSFTPEVRFPINNDQPIPSSGTVDIYSLHCIDTVSGTRYLATFAYDYSGVTFI